MNGEEPAATAGCHLTWMVSTFVSCEPPVAASHCSTGGANAPIFSGNTRNTDIYMQTTKKKKEKKTTLNMRTTITTKGRMLFRFLFGCYFDVEGDRFHRPVYTYILYTGCLVFVWQYWRYVFYSTKCL